MKQFLYIHQDKGSLWLERQETIYVHDDTGEYIAWIQDVYFVCPWCGEQWASLTAGEDIYDHYEHVLLPVSCERCWKPDYRSPVPGSILHNGFKYALGWHIVADPELINSLPPELISREFQLLMRSLECS